MMGFMFKMAIGQIAAKVVGNSISGQPIFSGFFSNPQQQQQIIYCPRTKQDDDRFIKWAFGEIFDSETILGDLEMIVLWNEKWGNLLYVNEGCDMKIMVRKMWDLWIKLEN